MSDPIAAFIRSERETLLQAAPPPHAARVWHEARHRRAASLRRTMRAAGWLVRFVVADAALRAPWGWPVGSPRSGPACQPPNLSPKRSKGVSVKGR